VDYAIEHARRDFQRVVILGAYTGQRGSDLIRMCYTDLETLPNGLTGFQVTQQKTKRDMWVPILPALAKHLSTWERAPGPLLRRLDGRPWSRESLTHQWQTERARHPVLAGCVLHGLRGYACVQLRQAGITGSLIADTVGMSLPMVERYCRFSKQRENASAVVLQLERTMQERNREQNV
jgi:integrase